MVLRHLIRPYLLISCILEKIISNMVTAMYREDGLGFLHDSRRLNHEASDTLLVIPDKDTTLGQISVSTTLAQGGKLDPENEALNIREKGVGQCGIWGRASLAWIRRTEYFALTGRNRRKKKARGGGL